MSHELSPRPSLFAHGYDNPVGPVVSLKDLATGQGHNPVHLFRHFIRTEEAELPSDRHIAETCPHVFISPSAVPSVVYVNPYSFSHTFRFNHFNRIYIGIRIPAIIARCRTN